MISLAHVKMMAIGTSLAFFACSDRHKLPGSNPDDSPHNITSFANLPGVSCGQDLSMALISVGSVPDFCIDRLEAAVDGGNLGNAAQGADDTDFATDGSTTASAHIALGVAPATGISWYQAKAACENAGKVLCNQAQWEAACRGAELRIYPYGDTYEEHACNGFFQYSGQHPATTGSWDTCGSASGVYDLSGNVEEWVATAVPRTPGVAINNDRAMRGGSWASNLISLACFGDEYHAPPASASEQRGFRCCSTPP